MGARARRFVAKPADGGVRVWDNVQKRWWGKVYAAMPTALLVELNGEKDGARIAEISKAMVRKKGAR